MSYSKPHSHFQTNLVAREGYSGVGGVMSSIESGASGLLQITGNVRDILNPQRTVTAASPEIPWIPILAVAGLAVGAIVLLRKKG
jgi:hypothetical protein